MTRQLFSMALLLAVVACGKAPEAPQMSDEKAVEMVKEANSKLPPIERLQPQPIGAPDIEQHSLYGAGCAFAPGDSMGTIFLAVDDSGYLKLEGELIRLARDSGVSSVDGQFEAKYDGKALSVRLTGDGAARGPAGEESAKREGQITISDAHKREVYAAEGTVQCGA